MGRHEVETPDWLSANPGAPAEPRSSVTTDIRDIAASIHEPDLPLPNMIDRAAAREKLVCFASFQCKVLLHTTLSEIANRGVALHVLAYVQVLDVGVAFLIAPEYPHQLA